MKYIRVDNQYIIRIDKGEEVVETLINFCKTQHITLASFTGIGACDYLKVGLFHTKRKEYKSKEFQDSLEITSLIGNITTKDNEPYLHAHVNVSNEEMESFGGHLNECRISATCEIFLTKIECNVKRTFNEDIGLNILDIEY